MGARCRAPEAGRSAQRSAVRTCSRSASTRQPASAWWRCSRVIRSASARAVSAISAWPRPSSLPTARSTSALSNQVSSQRHPSPVHLGAVGRSAGHPSVVRAQVGQRQRTGEWRPSGGGASDATRRPLRGVRLEIGELPGAAGPAPRNRARPRSSPDRSSRSCSNRSAHRDGEVSRSSNDQPRLRDSSSPASSRRARGAVIDAISWPARCRRRRATDAPRPVPRQPRRPPLPGGRRPQPGPRPPAANATARRPRAGTPRPYLPGRHAGPGSRRGPRSRRRVVDGPTHSFHDAKGRRRSAASAVTPPRSPMTSLSA